MNEQIETTISNLEQNGFEVVFVEHKSEALVQAKQLIPQEGTVGLGGSVTVQQIGLLDYLLKQQGLTVWNQYEKGISMEENVRRRREGLLADIYVTSTNAVTETGNLVNVDGDGNRVAALMYGPQKVLVIAGINKIVKDVAAGFKRIFEVAAPLNVERLKKKAATFGKTSTATVDSICNKFTYIRRCKHKGRITLVLVNEELGF